jgi:hypothetical protein
VVLIAAMGGSLNWRLVFGVGFVARAVLVPFLAASVPSAAALPWGILPSVIVAINGVRLDAVTVLAGLVERAVIVLAAS